jgi:nicotinamidase-related amidase
LKFEAFLELGVWCLVFLQSLDASASLFHFGFSTRPKMRNKIHRLRRSKSGLVIVDVQERLMPAIFERKRVVQNVVRLLRSAAIMGVPYLATEQYRKGLGATLPEVAEAVAEFAPLEKVAFSACGADGFLPALRAQRVSDVLLCGVEAHVCVLQTCMDLLEQKFRVFVVADAVSSRTLENACFGLERMRDAGAVVVSTEMALFELLERAGTEEFKQVLPLVK